MSTKLWDQYFLKIAKAVSTNSKCMSRQIGAVLVKDKAIIATGYNGPPRGIPHCKERHNSDGLLCKEFAKRDLSPPLPTKTFNLCPRVWLKYNSGEGLFLCPATHAEANCIAQAARSGISTLDTTMYLTCGVPCKNCLALLINAGVAEIVCTSLDYYDELSEFILGHSSLIVREYYKEEEI